MCVIANTQVKAQYTLKLNVDKDLAQTNIKQDYSLRDSLGVFTLLDSLRSVLYKEGYLAHSFDDVSFKDNAFRTNLHLGSIYEFADLELDPKDIPLLDLADLRLSDFNGKKISQERINKLFEKSVDHLNQSGFPFAKAGLKNTKISNGKLSGQLDFHKGAFITYDSIYLTGKVPLSNHYLEQYLGIKRDQPYEEKIVKEIKQRMQNLAFMQLEEDPSIRFVNDEAEIHLKTKPKKSSRFDFLIGIQQNQTPEGLRYTLTGEFTVEVLNRLGQGEYMFAEYKRLRPETQELELRFAYPYLPRLPIGIDAKFKLFRNSTEFLDLDSELGVQYNFNGRDILKGFWKYQTNRLLDIDSSGILNTQRLPENLDVQFQGVGLSMTRERLDYRFNPRKGYNIQLTGTVGFKKIIENPGIESLRNEQVDFANSFDSLNLNSYQYELHSKLAYYQPILSNLIIKTSNQSAYKGSAARIYNNEFFRIGGNRIMRGFDEQSIFTQFYSVFSFELRFLLAQANSNFTLSLPFIDYGFTYNPDREKAWDQPYGMGIGLNFETGAGLFNFAIAAGKQLENSLDFNNLKVHFGYESLF